MSSNSMKKFDNLEFRQLTVEDFDQVLDLDRSSFASSEPLNQMLHAPYIVEIHTPRLMAFLKQSASVGVFDKVTNHLVGFVLNSVEGPLDWEKKYALMHKMGRLDFTRALSMVKTEKRNLLNHFQFKKILDIVKFTICPGYRRLGLGTQLISRCSEIALKFECDAVCVLASSYFTQSICEKLNYNTFSEVDYAEYVEPETGLKLFTVVMSNSDRYECTLSAEALAKAVDELNEPEDNASRLLMIDQLRDAFINQDSGLELIRSDDAFILRFLRARKFDQERALKMLTNYHKQRVEFTEVFKKVDDPASLRPLFESGSFMALRGKALNGSSVLIGRPGKMKKTVFYDFIACVVVSMEKLLEDDEEVQVHGVTVIEDLFYSGLDLVKQIGPFLARRFLGLLQDAMPVRIKSVNIVNESKIFDAVFAIVRPFMKEKMKRRFEVHGSVFDSLHKKIDPSILPHDFGGTGSELDEKMIEEWTSSVLEEDTAL
ncbi:unnamed protein product [Clavelina lepadiformis]|uniref:CRAL-TRIO domain-containing protein n=1 Tax=Clavelina lepadiformis TaxID=159417 RepID=A0ABP0GIA3_CLALP